MNDDISAAEQGRRIITVGRIELIVIKQPAIGSIPNPDAELIHAASARLLVVNRCQLKVIAASARRDRFCLSRSHVP